MLGNKGCEQARNTVYPHNTALPWILQPKKSTLLSSSRMKTSYNDWSVLKSRPFTGASTKPPSGLKRFNLNMNKTSNPQKMLEERQTWLRKRTASKTGYGKCNKSGATYAQLFVQQFKEMQKLSSVKESDVAKESKQKLICKYKAKEHQTVNESKAGNRKCKPRPNKVSLNEIKLDNSKISKNASRTEKTEKNLVSTVKQGTNESRTVETSKDEKQMESFKPSEMHKGCIYDYKFGERVGKGAYAVVKEGLHISTNTPVAIKIYDKLKFSEPRRKKRLEQEMAILKKLDHRNIVKFFDYFQSAKHLHVVMEMVKGQSLRDYVKSTPTKKLDEENAIKILKEIGLAIEYCHSNGVLHRDIKLDNILIDKEGRVKVIDFGFSVDVGSQKLKTHCGTLSYMSPELVAKKEYLGAPADMWALGVVFYAMLFGKYPFSGKSDSELIAKIKEDNLKVGDEVSQRTQTLVRKFFELDPDKRLTAKELLSSL
eukprot:TRINITY_DN1108_c0_g1_i4.p1 TRINITY_DN1108_c0_g1~~TRINITY_DN1108_c0_g1_i4.p1  ORF type:complete len:484 (+),score=164.29 TRINITY_DN1108_c0_g1_i4:98-1549(+)